MSIFAGNLGSKMSLSLRFLVSAIPRIKRNNVILCLKGREFNSSSGPDCPVRYIPKRTSKSDDEKKHSLPMKGNEEGILDKNLDGVRSNFGLNEKAERLSFDDIRQFKQTAQEVAAFPQLEEKTNHELMPKSHEVMGELDVVVEELGMQQENKGKKDRKIQTLKIVKQTAQEVTAFPQLEEKTNHELRSISHEIMGELQEVVEEIGTPQEKDISTENMTVHKSREDADKLAIGLLAKRAYTAVELRGKLHGKRFPHDIADKVIIDFRSRGLINDGLYAETFSRSRWSSSSWGPKRIKQALSKKGVNEADMHKALKLVFEDDDSGEQESKVSLSKLSMDHLLVQASKQWVRGTDVPEDKRKARLIRWLQYRGFNWDVVNFVVKKLESQHTS